MGSQRPLAVLPRPTEVEQPIKGWADLEQYWAPPGGAPKIIEGLWNVYTNLVPKLIAPDVCVVLWDMPHGSANDPARKFWA